MWESNEEERSEISEMRKELNEIKNDVRELKQMVNSMQELLLSLHKAIIPKSGLPPSPLLTSSSFRVNSRRNSKDPEFSKPTADSTKEREKSSREFAGEDIEEDLRLKVLETTKELSIPPIEKFLRFAKGSPAALALEELIGVLKSFRCNRQAADEFIERINTFSSILFELTSIAEKSPSYSFSISLQTFTEELKKAKHYLQKFSKSGFLLLLLKGNEPQEKFNQIDEKLSTKLIEMATYLHLENHKLITSLSSSCYSYHVICNLESNFHVDIQQLLNDTALQEKIANLLYCPLGELQQEVKEYLQKTLVNNEKLLLFVEDGIHCQLNVLILRQFWKSFISPSSQVRMDILVKHMQTFLLQHERESKETADQLTRSLKEVLISLQQAKITTPNNKNGLGLDTHQGWIDIYQLKQWTLSLPEDASIQEVIQTLLQWKSAELITKPIHLLPPPSAVLKYFSFDPPSINRPSDGIASTSSRPIEFSNVIVWGNELEKKLMKRLQLSIGITLIHGPANVGKTFRLWKLLQNLEERLESKQSIHIVWINCEDFSQKKSFLAAINKQLHLLCEDYDTILPTLENKINSLLETNSVILVFDHMNPDISNSILTFLSKLQCNLIFISRSSSSSSLSSSSATSSTPPAASSPTPLPLSSPQNKLQTLVSSAGGQSIYIDALSEAESIELAMQLGKSEKSAKLLANAAKRLPGNMVAYLELTDPQLCGNVNGRSSSGASTATTTNGPHSLASFFSKLTHTGSKIVGLGNGSSHHSGGGGSSHHQNSYSNSHVYNESSIVLTPLERFIYDCLAPVLSNGIHFQKNLCWSLCKEQFEQFEDHQSFSDQDGHGHQDDSLNISMWNKSFESLIRKGIILHQGNYSYSLIPSPASTELPIIFAPPSQFDNNNNVDSSSSSSFRQHYPLVDDKEQMKTYYLYWCKELKRIHELIEGQEQKQGLFLYDQHQHHFEILFKFIKEMILIDPSTVLEFVIYVAPNLIRIANLRLSLQESLQFYKLLVCVFQSTNVNNHERLSISSTHSNGSNANPTMMTMESITIDPLNCEKNSWKLKDSQVQNAFLMSICGYSIFLYTSSDIHNAEIFINSAMKGVEWLESVHGSSGISENGKTIPSIESFLNKITICTTKGLILLASKRFKESIEMFSFTLQLLAIHPSKTTFLANDKSLLPKRIRLQLNLSSAYRNNHQLEKALDLYEDCMIAGKDLIGEENSDLAIVYRSIADIYSTQIQKELKGLDGKGTNNNPSNQHPNVISQANVITLKNSMEKVIFLYEKSLSIAFHTFGEIHHNIGLIDYSYGLFLYHLSSSFIVASSPILSPAGDGSAERLEKSLGYLEKAEKIWKFVHGNHYSMLAACYYSICLIHEKKGDLVRAVYYLEQAIAIKRTTGSNDSTNHNSSSHSLSSMSLLAAGTGSSESSRLSEELALYTYKMGSLLEKQNNLSQSLKLFEESLSIRRALHQSRSSLEYTNALAAYGRLLMKVHPTLTTPTSNNTSNSSSPTISNEGGTGGGNSNRAHPETLHKMIEIFRELIPLQRKHYGESHQVIINSLTNLGNIYLKLDNAKDATSALEEAASMIQAQLSASSSSSSSPLTPSVLTSLQYQQRNIQKTLENIQIVATPPTSPALSLPMASPLSSPPPPSSFSSTASSYFSSSKK
jgi:tetratricopeptide (TPR) repeat protein